MPCRCIGKAERLPIDGCQADLKMDEAISRLLLRIASSKSQSRIRWNVNPLPAKKALGKPTILKL